MKISYRTHPVLEFLSTKKLGTFLCYQCDIDIVEKNISEMRDHFWKVSVGINHQIYYLTQPFIGAFEKAGDKLFESKLWGDIEEDNICFMHPCFDDKNEKEATLLKIRRSEGSKDVLLVDCFSFRNIVVTMAGTYVIDCTSGRPVFSRDGFLSKNIEQFEFHILNLLLITLFIKYAKVEIKVLGPKQKKRDIDCKYVNETNCKISVLDSRWFNTLIKSDAFKVRGHFRLQPKKKNGEWTKELIWINEFEKSGYIAPARRLSLHP